MGVVTEEDLGMDARHLRNEVRMEKNTAPRRKRFIPYSFVEFGPLDIRRARFKYTL